jgi:hypothetical protein
MVLSIYPIYSLFCRNSNRIRGGKNSIVYLKDRSTGRGSNYSKNRTLEVFKADITNWLKYLLSLINTKSWQ